MKLKFHNSDLRARRSGRMGVSVKNMQMSGAEAKKPEVYLRDGMAEEIEEDGKIYSCPFGCEDNK